MLLTLVCVGALVSCGSGSGSGGRAGGPLDATFTKLDGGQSSFAVYRGKPVVVNFFASTCAPCVQEMPDLEQLHQQLGDKVAFLGIDVQETATAAAAFLGGPVHVTWDIGRDPDASILQQKLSGIGLPTTALLGPDGSVVKKWLGRVDIGELTSLIHSKGYA